MKKGYDITDSITGKARKDNCFTVPEGYFDTLTDRIMSELPENDKTISMETVRKSSVMHRMLKPIITAAACICVAVFGLTMYLSDSEQTADIAYDSNYSMEEAMIDYAMMDNADIYAYLASEY